MSGFVHLHLHTEYSLLDGACRIDELMERVLELGQDSVAITDHGVMYGAVDFYKAARQHGVRPIIGCEVYVAPRSRHDKVHRVDSSPAHLVLLCENQTGYQNLIKLVSLGFTEGFYFKPRVDHELLERYSEGLICLSACLAGEIPRQLLAGNYEEAKETALFYQRIFGKENYFLEVQDHGIREQRQIIPQIVRLSRETGIPVVATNDAHYIRKEDSRMQKVLVCIQTNHTIDEDSDLEFETEEFYLKSQQEMEQLFAQIPGAIENTQRIADRCRVEFEFGHHKLPLFIAPDHQDNRTYFRDLCYQGLHRLYGEHPDTAVTQRLEYELGVIESMGYVDYYLIVFDFIHYAKQHGIPVGPGRGSGAGSLAAYCIGITGIDPMKYNLLFERFLNPERVSMPDFDVDFCYERRQEVIDYVIEKYGKDKVAQIVTFGTMAARAAIRDVGRALGMSYQTVDEVAKKIPAELHITIEQALAKTPQLRTLCEENPQIRELVEMARRVEGMPRHASTHAAGVVITREPVSSYVPLATNDESVVTQFTMTTLEELGLLKIDFLGLRNLTIISDAEKMIRRRLPQFHMQQISYDDPAVFEMLSAGDTSGVFQFESGGMRQVLTQLRPASLEDMIAVLSLYRPGPMQSIPKYIKNRHNPQNITYLHPLLQPILEVTYGCIVYQEQVMQICREMAGFSYGHADLVRRAMAKKKAAEMEKERQNFLEGAAERGVPQAVANAVFDEISAFASYAFNKSHAASYACVAYQTAYLKRHYPCEYMAALLTSVLDNNDKVVEYTGDCAKMGIRILPPSINESYEGFTAGENTIRFGLLAIRNIGRGLIGGIIREREQHGRFTGFVDFLERMSGSSELNKRTLESLIKSGSMDGLDLNRRQMLHAYSAVLSDLETAARNNIEGQINMFAMPEHQQNHSYTFEPLEEFPMDQRLRMEKETTGLFISGHPLAQYEPYLAANGVVDLVKIISDEQRLPSITDHSVVRVLCVVNQKRLKTTRNGQVMAFVQVEDRSGSAELLLFPKTVQTVGNLLQEGEIVLITARVSLKEDETRLICEDAALPQVLLTAQQQIVSNTPMQPRRPMPSMQGNRPDPVRAEKLYLKVPSKESELFHKAQCYLKIFEGTTPVYVFFEDTGKLTVAPKSLWTDLNPPLLKQLRLLLGEDKVATR